MDIGTWAQILATLAIPFIEKLINPNAPPGGAVVDRPSWIQRNGKRLGTVVVLGLVVWSPRIWTAVAGRSDPATTNEPQLYGFLSDDYIATALTTGGTAFVTSMVIGNAGAATYVTDFKWEMLRNGTVLETLTLTDGMPPPFVTQSLRGAGPPLSPETIQAIGQDGIRTGNYIDGIIAGVSKTLSDAVPRLTFRITFKDAKGREYTVISEEKGVPRQIIPRLQRDADKDRK